jgi:hypothetical protein
MLMNLLMILVYLLILFLLIHLNKYWYYWLRWQYILKYMFKFRIFTTSSVNVKMNIKHEYVLVELKIFSLISFQNKWLIITSKRTFKVLKMIFYSFDMTSFKIPFWYSSLSSWWFFNYEIHQLFHYSYNR